MQRIKKRLIAAAFAILIVASAMVGVSAKDNIAPLDWGYGFASATSSTTTVDEYTFYNSAASVFNGNVTRLVSSAVGFTLDSGYTYTYTATYHVSPSIPAFTSVYSTVYQVPLDEHLIVYYTYSAFSDGVRQSVSSLDTDKYLYSVSLENGGETVVVTLVINTDKSGLVPSDVYFYCPFLALYRSPSSYPALTMGNSGLTVIKDLDGSAFDKSIIDAVNAIREDNENYHSNALELLDEIANAGSDYPLPDSAASQLGNSLGSLSSAESSLSSKADELRTAGSSTMNSAIAAAKDLPNKIGSSTSFLTSTFTKFWEAVPPEVTAVLLVCAAILFAGWLLGRVQ